MTATGRFKLLQFNMQFGQPWDDVYPDHVPINLQLTIDEIRSHDADLVMLQEVEHALPAAIAAELRVMKSRRELRGVTFCGASLIRFSKEGKFVRLGDVWEGRNIVLGQVYKSQFDYCGGPAAQVLACSSAEGCSSGRMTRKPTNRASV